MNESLAIAVKAASEKHAEDIVVLDVQNISILADYFVICHGNNERQIAAIMNEIIEQEEKHGVTISRIEGRESSKWILIDLGNIVVHIFQEQERDFYQLERLWSDAPIVNLRDIVGDDYVL